MRLANIADRSTLVTPNSEIIDISQATGGRFSPRIQEWYERWDELLDIAAAFQGATGRPLVQVPLDDIGNPAPQPRQVFAIGLNYAAHAAEAALAVPEDLTVFTKFVTRSSRACPGSRRCFPATSSSPAPSRCWGWPRACALSLAGRRTCHVHERRR